MKPSLIEKSVPKICYASPVIATTMLIAPLNIIQGIYAKYFGMALTTLALIMVISRLADAISDPIIGYFSDRYRTYSGSRKPLMAAGGVLVLISGYFVYVPPDNVTPFFLGVCIIILFTAFTLFEIPHQTWPSDINTGSEDGGHIAFYSYRVFATYIGLIAFYSIPLLPYFETRDITPETLEVAFYLAVLIIIPGLFFSLRQVPSGPAVVKSRASPSMPLPALVRMLVSNKPFLIFLSAFVFSGFSVGMWYGVIFIYVDSYLHQGELFSSMFLFAFLVGMAFTPLCYRLALKYGKKRLWMLGMGLLILSYSYTGFLQPGSTSVVDLVLLKTVQTCGFVCVTVVTPTMLAEIVDYSQLKYGVENNGTYFSIKIFFEKLNIAGGMSLSLAIAGWYGFDVGAGVHPAETTAGLKLAGAWVPSVSALLALILVYFSPIDERRHNIIRRRLEVIKSRDCALLSQ